MPPHHLSILRHSLELRCVTALLRSAEGRAHSLRRLWAYKQNLSILPVELLVRPLGDPALDRLCQRRREDEQRHADAFSGMLRGMGTEPESTDELLAQPLHRLLQFPVDESCDVMWTFLTLQVLYETFVVVLKGFARGCEDAAPEVARVLKMLAADDERFLNKVTATAVRYEGSAAMREMVLERLRKSHARACTRVRLQEFRVAAQHVQGANGVALNSLVRMVSLLPPARLEAVAQRERPPRPLGPRTDPASSPAN